MSLACPPLLQASRLRNAMLRAPFSATTFGQSRAVGKPETDDSAVCLSRGKRGQTPVPGHKRRFDNARIRSAYHLEAAREQTFNHFAEGATGDIRRGFGYCGRSSIGRPCGVAFAAAAHALMRVSRS